MWVKHVDIQEKLISNIRRRWRRCRLRCVADQSRSGRPSLITARYRRELRRALLKGPATAAPVEPVATPEPRATAEVAVLVEREAAPLLVLP